MSRVESDFHAQMWGLANDSMRMERAVSEARQLILALLPRTDDKLLKAMADNWLGEFGQ